jgi:carboxylesterase type B
LPFSEYVTADEQVEAIMRDWWFLCPALAVAGAMSAVASPATPVYSYQFEFPISGPMGDVFGDYHSAEVPYVFNNPRAEVVATFFSKPRRVLHCDLQHWTTRDDNMASLLGCLWSSLATDHVPNKQCLGGSLAWPTYQPGPQATSLVFSETPFTRTNYNQKHCNFWASIGF